MWDLPSEGTFSFSKENDESLIVLEYLKTVPIEKLATAYLEYEVFQRTGYTSVIHSPHSLGYKLLLKFESSAIKLSITEECHEKILKMYSIVCQELARRHVIQLESSERDPGQAL